MAVRGVSLNTKPFQEDAFALSVSAHGALVALATTVSLGQKLYLRNPQTQDEAQVWVTRFGPDRGARKHIGIEFVQPNPEFWSPERQVGPPSEGQTQASPDPGEISDAEPASSNDNRSAPQTETASPHSGVAREETLPGILLRSIEQSLQLAAENVVAAATTTRVRAAVTQAAEAIENFSNGKIRQFEERLAQYRELAKSANEDSLSRIKTAIAQTEEHLRNRAAELLEETARNTHNDFEDKLREAVNQAVAKFGEEAAGSSAQHLANFSERVQAAVNEARSQVDHAVTTLNETREKISGEADRAVTEMQQKIESLSSQRNELYVESESRIQAFREDLAQAAEHEIGRFRERLQSGLSSLFSHLG